MSLAAGRLQAERKAWRKDHPHKFVAKFETRPDGSSDVMNWHCAVPGKAGTPWEGGIYTVKLSFPADFPNKPPQCRFAPPIFHPNVYDNGTICLDIINDPSGGGTWRPSLTVKQVLLGIQELLNTPNIDSPAQQAAYQLLRTSPAQYERRVREEAKKYAEVL